LIDSKNYDAAEWPEKEKWVILKQRKESEDSEQRII
jgi:hypothetical protein